MRRVRYEVATSLDGYIAGPNGEFDWIAEDPEIDMEAVFQQFDTLLIGSRTFEMMVRHNQSDVPGMKIFVFSHSLNQRDYPHVTMIGDGAEGCISALKQQEGKDIWLFGGGELFRSVLKARLVDTVEVMVSPILLGGGIRLLPAPAEKANLKLTSHRVYKAGIVSLHYDLVP